MRRLRETLGPQKKRNPQFPQERKKSWQQEVFTERGGVGNRRIKAFPVNPKREKGDVPENGTERQKTKKGEEG